uniref:C-type lectin domain-containing protein n=1 Tax=Callorhinchus milii TaxID=7868 RepID=A0A4W3GGY2_CALMI
ALCDATLQVVVVLHTTTGWNLIVQNCKSLKQIIFYFKATCALVVAEATLPSIHTEKQNDFLHDLVSNATKHHDRPFWIGFNDINVEGNFKWSDGSKINFINWYNEVPDDFNEHEDCVHMNHHIPKKWNDLPCDEKLPYVCAYQNKS